MFHNPKLALTAAFLCLCGAAQALNVGTLRTQYLTNPMGIDTETPHFSWQLSSDTRSTVQVSYQVQLSTDAGMGAIVYDSGIIESPESANVVLENLNLEPSTRYYWTVTVTDNHGESATSAPGSFFETGLMNSGWSGAKWITVGNGEAQLPDEGTENVTDYTISTDFEIDRIAAGFIWGATDRNNYYMWQFNTEDSQALFRPHVWAAGNPRCLEEKPLDIPLKNGEVHNMRIEVSEGGTLARTYLDGTLIDERKGSFPYGVIGMRSSTSNREMNYPEVAYYDDFKVSASDGRILFQDDFTDNEAFGFGRIVRNSLLLSGPELLGFQKNFTSDESVKNYTFEGKFTIDQIAAGILFAGKDANNFYMWQFNVEQSTPRFRPHRWNGGNAACLENVDLSETVAIEADKTYDFKIEVTEDGKRATTYLNGVQIDSRQGDFIYGKIGFRQSKGEKSSRAYERAYFDNISVTTPSGEVLYSENFDDPENCTIPGATILDGRMRSGTFAESYLWAVSGSAGDSKLRYDIDADITLISDAASIVFSRTKSNCYFMWAINTNDKGYPLVRRHVYANSSNPQFSDTRINGMTNADFLGKERHLRLEINGTVVRTYIDGTLVDTFTDTTGLLTNGLIGFRVYRDVVNEQAYWDNVKVTVYNADGSKHVSLSEDFENDNYEFSSGMVVDVNGNRKLHAYSAQYENMILQDAATASPRFRKGFTLNGKVRSARLYSSALGVYNLYINGTRVGNIKSDGSTVYDELMPGWTDYRSSIFYLTHDVTTLLHEGENALGAEVSSGWWLGQVSHGIYGGSGLAFIGKLVVELESGETVTIVSDPTWLSSSAGPIKSGDIYHGESYDARRAEAWTAPDYNTTLWNPCIEDRQIKGTLMGHEGPTVQILPHLERKAQSITVYEGIKANGTTYGEINTIATHNGSASVNLAKGQTMVVDFGQNASGWAKFKVHGKAGTVLRLRYAEMVNDSGDTERGNDDAKGTLYTIALRSAKAQGQYILCGDEEGEVYSPTSTFYGFRYCDLTSSDDVVIEWITAETISTANEEDSYVKVDNADVNQLFSNILWGQRSNFVSVPTDCPQRDERLGWTADTQVFSMAASYNAQVQGFYHKWMRDMRDGQLSTGQYPNVAPFNWVEHGSSAWADAGIIMPWNVYTMYGDKAIIEENYDSMVRYMDWIATQTENGYKHVGSDTRYGDWLAFESTDNRLVSVSYYGYMADIMSRMSKVLSTADNDYYAQQAEKYAQLFEDIKGEFKKRYWNVRRKYFTPTSQCAMLMALRYNLLHDDEAVESTRTRLREAIEKNNNTLSTGFLGTAILNQTLSEHGMDDLAYALLLQHNCPSWLYSVDQGATTMWERWNSYTREGGFSKSIEMNSFNHYAYGAVAEWMYRYMAGIAPDYEQPGFSHIILQPSFDAERRITDVDASFASNYGHINSAWNHAADGSFVYTVTVPANTTATLNLPALPEGMKLFEGQNLAENAEGISDYAESAEGISMTLGSGTYSFAAGVEPPASVETITMEGFSVYPNPASDIVTVRSSSEIRHIELRSASGVLTAESSDSASLSVAHCAPGIYLLTATDAEGRTATAKVIKR